jgi:hypothetical protein
MSGYTSTNTQEFGKKLAKLVDLVFDEKPNNTQVPEMVTEVMNLITTFSAMGFSPAGREAALGNVVKGAVDYGVETRWKLPATMPTL